MTEVHPDLLWTQPAWLEQVHRWIESQLQALGLEMTGPIEQSHIRPWSTVLRFPTPARLLYFKATPAAFAQEAALTAALAQWCPEATVPVLAADTQKGWLLLQDGGIPLRQILQADRDIRHWQRVLPVYAQMQKALAPRVADLLALGVPDRRLTRLPFLYRRLLEDTDILGVGQADGLSAEEYRRLQALTPQVENMCGELAACGVAETLQHDDLHDGNILVNQGRYLPFDWGDSCVSHPFFTLLVVRRSVERTLALPEGDPALMQLVDAYLGEWAEEFAPHDLRHACDLAQRLGMLSRALTWYGLIVRLEGQLSEDHRWAVSGWLQEFLQQSG